MCFGEFIELFSIDCLIKLFVLFRLSFSEILFTGLVFSFRDFLLLFGVGFVSIFICIGGVEVDVFWDWI